MGRPTSGRPGSEVSSLSTGPARGQPSTRLRDWPTLGRTQGFPCVFKAPKAAFNPSGTGLPDASLLRIRSPRRASKARRWRALAAARSTLAWTNSRPSREGSRPAGPRPLFSESARACDLKPVGAGSISSTSTPTSTSPRPASTWGRWPTPRTAANPAARAMAAVTGHRQGLPILMPPRFRSITHPLPPRIAKSMGTRRASSTSLTTQRRLRFAVPSRDRGYSVASPRSCNQVRLGKSLSVLIIINIRCVLRRDGTSHQSSGFSRQFDLRDPREAGHPPRSSGPPRKGLKKFGIAERRIQVASARLCQRNPSGVRQLVQVDVDESEKTSSRIRALDGGGHC